MAFWVDWELWEKMCFVLGCLIVIVLAYGFGVQIYNTSNIKKVTEHELRLKAQHASTVGMQGSGEDDIPFGSRAIESGIEVEGIWISNHNTPRPSPQPPGTPEGSRPPSSRSTQSHQLDVDVHNTSVPQNDSQPSHNDLHMKPAPTKHGNQTEWEPRDHMRPIECFPMRQRLPGQDSDGL